MASALVRVINLRTGEEQLYTSSPVEAVIAAYACAKQDYNTWQYTKYKKLVQVGAYTVSCGDWTALKSRNPH